MGRYIKTVGSSCLFLLVITTFAQNYNRRGVYKAIQKQDAEIDSDWDSPNFFVPNITPDKIGKIGLVLNDPFNKDEALLKIFPGYHYLYKGVPWAIWRSTKYPSRKLLDDNEYHDFPGKRKNLTCVGDVKRYTDDSGRKNILMSFGSIELMPTEMMNCGHYSGADISVAHFMKNENKWALKDFTMGLGCYGNWHRASAIDTIKLGKDNYGVIIDREVNPPGGPGYASYHVYGLVNAQYKEVLTLEDARCYMGMVSGWGTKIKRLHTTLPFDDLRLISTGDFDGAAYDSSFNRYGDTTIDLPRELYGHTANAYSFSFRITRLYHFQDGKYKMVNTKIHVYHVVKRKKSGNEFAR